MSYFLVGHGMKGSFAGIEFYEVILDGGWLAGRVYKLKTKWRYRIGKYDVSSEAFNTRKAAIEAMIIVYRTRNPEHPSYMKDCEVCHGLTCRECYAGEK